MSQKIDLTDDLLSRTSEQAEYAASWIEELDIPNETNGRWSAKIPVQLMVSASALTPVVLFMDNAIGPHGWWRRIMF